MYLRGTRENLKILLSLLSYCPFIQTKRVGETFQLRLSERHKGDPPQDITVFDKGRLFSNKGGLLRNKAGLLQNSETIFRFSPSPFTFMLFYTLLKAITPDSL